MKQRAMPRKTGKPAKGHLHMDDASLKMRYRVPIVDDDADMETKSNRLALKRLRNRANITAKQAAQAVGKGESGYMRYEDDRRFDDEPIPAVIVMGLLPLMVGRGDPPVRQDELLGISEIANIHDVLQSGFRPSKATVRETPGEYVPNASQLPVRYQIEAGTFRAMDRVKGTTYGASPILPLRSYPQGAQWCAVINDNSAAHLALYPGSLLHCVDVTACTEEMLERGSLVVAAAANGDLVEIVCGLVVNHGRGGARLKVGKEEIDGAQILGVAVYRYGPTNTRPV